MTPEQLAPFLLAELRRQEQRPGLYVDVLTTLSGGQRLDSVEIDGDVDLIALARAVLDVVNRPPVTTQPRHGVTFYADWTPGGREAPPE